MEKEFVPYEQALALKELGFDEECFAYYLAGAIRFKEYKDSKNKNSAFYNNTVCSMPTFSQAFRWFREKGYFYSIEICQEKHPLKSKYSFSLYGKNFYEEDYPNEYGWIDDFPMFTTYEKAELECLKKLIEIVRQK